MPVLPDYPAPQGFIAWHPVYAHPLPEGHRFPMMKYELIPQSLLYEGVAAAADLFRPEPLDEAVITLTHDNDYWQRMKDLQLTEREMRAVGFPLSAQLVERERRIARGTIDCALYALAGGRVALNVAGGTHHAFPGHGEGFCLLNDFAVAANYLLHTGKAGKVLIADLDVHQGNGTAAFFRDEPRVFTFSMHGQHNYPFRKERSDLDIGLPDGLDGAGYLGLLAQHLPALLDTFQPDIVFYLSGVDVLATDKYGKLQLSRDDCYARDAFVFRACSERRLPVAVSMGGGYSPKLSDIVNAHTGTFKAAISCYH